MSAINPQMLFQTRSPRHSQKQTENNIDLVRTVLLNQIKLTPEGLFPGDQLGLIFDQNDQKDIDQIRDLLSNKLSYPSSQISELHMMANRLGTLDLKQKVGYNSQFDNNSDFKQISQNAQFCPCCGFILQDSTLGICTDIKDINHIGVSTFLYFQTVKHLIGLLIVMFFVFVIYAIVSNIVASNNYRKSINDPDIPSDLVSFQGFLIISLGSKQLHETQDDKTSYLIQCWLGVAVVVLWGILFALIKQRERSLQIDVDSESKTASDYTLMIKNYPKNLTLQQFEKELNQYKKSIGTVFSLYEKEPIKVAKINLAIPFYLNKQSFDDPQLKQLNQSYEQYQQTFIEWILQRKESPHFLTAQQTRKQKYKQFEELKKKREQLYLSIAQKIKDELGETVPAFVTFQNSYNKQLLQHLHDNDGFFARNLPCVNKQNMFFFKRVGKQQQNAIAQIRPAPEPEDVIWTNLGQDSYSIVMKKVFTFGITIIILAGSFGAIYGLSKVQFEYSKTHTDASNQYISILISLCVSFINIIIQQIIRVLTKLERDRTSTYHQASLGFKAVWALLINSILIPILVNWFFKENLFGINGLAYDVFYLGITNSFLSPLLKIFDGYYYFTRFLNWYKNHPNRRLYQNQNQLNAVSEYMQFQIGYEYIYMVNLFLFTCFFASLQPIIVVFAITGLAIMYWAQKYSLLNRCKRPAPGLNSINTTMYQLIYLGPAFYSIGSFCWSHFFKHNFIGIAPNLVAAILSGVIFLIPYKKIIKAIFGESLVEPRVFQKDRIFLPSQYDRLNPATSEAGIRDYQNYLGQFKKQLKYKKPQQIKQIQNQFLRQFGLGGRKNEAILPRIADIVTFNTGGLFNNNQMGFQNIFSNNNNIMNPFLIGNTVLYDNNDGSPNNVKNPMNMMVQNWMTNREKAEIVTYDKQEGGGIGGLFKITDSVMRNNNHAGYNNMNNNTDNELVKPAAAEQGYLVTYESGDQPLQINRNGQINLVYSLVNTIPHINNGNNRSPNNRLPPLNPSRESARKSQQIPLNIPLNILTPLLSFNTGNASNNQAMKEQHEGTSSNNKYFRSNSNEKINPSQNNNHINNTPAPAPVVNPFAHIMGGLAGNQVNNTSNGWYDPYQVNLFNNNPNNPYQGGNNYGSNPYRPY